MSYIEDKRVLLTGGAGFLGNYVREELKTRGAGEIIVPRSREYDLRQWNKCKEAVKDTDIVIHLAAKVGGIGYNRQYPGSLFYDNAIMGIQLMEAARQENVDKFVAVGTICAYPKYTPVPFREEELWNGYPEETNAPYGLAKKMMLVQSQAYRQQYDFNSIYLLPVNLYGPGDNFNPESSHVIPALIKKFAEAVENNSESIDIWGTGNASREFFHVKDAARGIVMATEAYNESDPINLGYGMEITIGELVEKMIEISNFKGEIAWDKTKPDGQPRRCLDVSRAEEKFRFKAEVNFDDGLRETYLWYLSNK